MHELTAAEVRDHRFTDAADFGLGLGTAVRDPWFGGPYDPEFDRPALTHDQAPTQPQD